MTDEPPPVSLSFRLNDGPGHLLGSPEFLYAFLSTITHHLEPEGQATRYPVIVNGLNGGRIEAFQAEKGIAEANEIRVKLRHYKPDDVIWDLDDIQAKPPWGSDISPHITDLSNYFVTSDGKDLFEVLLVQLDNLQKSGGALIVE